MAEERIVDEEEIRLSASFESKEIISCGNREMDKKMAGGIPKGSLTLVEGLNGTGKSVLTQQLMWGGLQQGCSFATYTTENTIKSLLKQMESLAEDISEYFVLGKLKIYPTHIEGMKWANHFPFLEYISSDVRTKSSEIILIDSLTVFVSEASDNDILSFFLACKDICDSGKTIMITAHPFAFEEEVLTRVRSICDAHLTLKKEEVGGRLVRTLEVAKIRGAQRTTDNLISFEVVPGIGLRIIPVSRTKA